MTPVILDAEIKKLREGCVSGKERWMDMVVRGETCVCCVRYFHLSENLISDQSHFPHFALDPNLGNLSLDISFGH